MIAALGRGHVVLFVAGDEIALWREEPRPVGGAAAVVNADADFEPDAILQGQSAEVLLPIGDVRGRQHRDFFGEDDDLRALRGKGLHKIVISGADVRGVGRGGMRADGIVDGDDAEGGCECP